ncbi:AAA family ATPase, partial [bacterium]|nr:AAA family ATPase [bacterium]
MDPLAERLRTLARAVGLERDAEIAFHRHEMTTLSGEERQRRGRALMGLRALSGGRALGERSLTVLRPGPNTASPGRTAISRGDLVRLSLEAAPEREIAIATVWSLGATITVATSRPPNCGREPLRLDLWSQDVTFQRMEAALERFGGPPGRRWRERLYGQAPRWRPLEPGAQPPQDLDAAQSAAWKRAVTARDWSLVQGPPGTGKTTTATAIAHTRIAAGDRVLLTGPTNVAADNLALGLL